MTTQTVRLQDLTTRVATECKALHLKTGTLSSLTTTDKSSLVAAMIELQAEIVALAAGSGALINDASTTSTTETYSVFKIVSAINDSIAAALAALVGSAPGALDTIQELAAQLATDETAASALATAVGLRVRFDAAQTLTAPQKVQANANMGSAALVDTGTLDTNYVTLFETGLT